MRREGVATVAPAGRVKVWWGRVGQAGENVSAFFPATGGRHFGIVELYICFASGVPQRKGDAGRGGGGWVEGGTSVRLS